MRRVHLACLIALLAALLAACGSAPIPKFAPPPSSSLPGNPTTTAAADLMPPVMPELAKKHTVAGAKAFVDFVLATLNYTEGSLDSRALGRVFSPGCAGCSGVIAFIQRVKNGGGSLSGGEISGRDFGVAPLSAGGHRLLAVSLRYHSTRQVVRVPGHAPKVYPDASAPLTLIVSARNVGWLVTSWEAHR